MGSLGHFCPWRRAGASACLIACAARNVSIPRRPAPYGPVGPLVARAAYRIKVVRTLRVRNTAHGVCGLLGANDAQHRLAHESSYPGRALGDAVSTRNADTVFQLTRLLSSTRCLRLARAESRPCMPFSAGRMPSALNASGQAPTF